MKSFTKLALGLSLLAGATSVISSPTPKVPKKAAGSVPSTNGRLFNINGKTQYFAGTNSWYMGHFQDDADVDLAMSQIAATGYDVTRVWGFGSANDATSQSVYYQLMNSTGQHFNMDPKTGIPRLDAAVASAEKHNVKLVLPLLNNWDDLGGINTYTKAYGGTATSFYTDAASQKAYQAYIAFIVNRYKASPAIFSWELCNEPRCHGCAATVMTKWASDTSAYIKSLDPNHMVALGDEGWLTGGDGSYAYSGQEGVDFAANLAIPTLDYGTFHLYPFGWGYDDAWGSQYIKEHDAIGKRLGKPVVLEEYGSPDAGTHVALTKPWQDTVVSSDSGIAMDSIWQFGTKLVSGAQPFDNFAIMQGTSDYDVLATKHVQAMHAKAV